VEFALEPEDAVETVIPGLELELKSDEQNCIQFNPALWNYASIDSVIVKLERVMIAVQVTKESPAKPNKAVKTVKFFRTRHWEKFAFSPEAAWEHHILWISDIDALPTHKNISHHRMSFKDIFALGGISMT